MKKDESEEYIDFISIRNSVCFESNNCFPLYLSDVFTDLCHRVYTGQTQSRKEKKSLPSPTEINELIFSEYMGMILFISERLFNSLDKSKKKLLNKKQFITGLYTLYLGSFEETIESIFSIYDFNSDGKINKKDVKLLLSYLPLKLSEYKDQMKSLKELDDTLNLTFSKAKNEELTLKEYIDVIKNVKSDSYLQLLLYLYNSKPFSIEAVNSYKNLKTKASIKPTVKNSLSNERIPSPSKKSIFAPAETFFIAVGNTPVLTSRKPRNLFNNITLIPNSITTLRRMDTEVENPKSPIKKKSKFATPGNPKTNSKNSVSPCKKKQIKSSFHVPSNKKDNDEEDQRLIFKYNEETPFLLHKFYFELYDTDLALFLTKSKSEIKYLYTLKGTFITKGDKQILDSSEFFPIEIHYSNNEKMCIFFPKEKTRNDTLTEFKKAINNLDFEDYYTVGEILGKGGFGTVHKGKNIQTGKEVAIKIINKKNLKHEDYEMIIRENSTLKHVRHQHLISLIDYFENDLTIYIIMELLEGGDLVQYMEKNGYLNEKTAAKILKQVALGIRYMNFYGLLHRDLKPDNIAFARNGDISSVKIVDFGLTRTLASGERASETMGTINYIAPEIIQGKPYDFKVDVWSMGVILYFTLSGIFPFDDESMNELLIEKKIVYTEQDYPKDKFGDKSKQCIDLIDKCLVKNPDKRISIEEFLAHSWIKQ